MYKLFLKRIIDAVGALIILVIFILPIIVISFLIKIDSKGPILYKQRRVGKETKEFIIFKFRTMVFNADKIGGFSTFKHDARITRVGAFLRKWSLDEIPQFVNVLLGDMSLIGPRPDVPKQKDNYSDKEYIDRHSVLPGITGLAQCRNRHNLTNRGRKKYDIFYNNKLSFMLDIKIIFWTFKVLIKGSY